MASHTEASNIRPSKVEPLHVELPAVGDSHIETSTRPEPGLVRGLERGEAPAATGRGPLAVLCQRIITDLTGASAAGAA